MSFENFNILEYYTVAIEKLLCDWLLYNSLIRYHQ